MPVRLTQDRGLTFVDQNAYRSPKFPLEPLFRSVYTSTPTFDPKGIQLVTDRNNLRKLTWFVSRIPIENFRIDIEMVGNTLLFTRWESIPYEVITGFRGFGHEFEKNFTTYSGEMKASTGHHRVVQYMLGTLQLLVRFEVDGYVERGTISKSSVDVDQLSHSLKSMQLRSESNDTVKAILGGHTVPQDSLIELKTRVKHRPIQTSDVIYQLWFGGVQQLFASYHVRGVFSKVEQSNFEKNGEFERFERDKKLEISKLVSVIERIKKAMMGVSGKRAILLHEGQSLRMYERKGDKHALPKDLLAKWD